ncbi:MAG: PCRF domain-containing protein, partial [Spirochaetales bacterium]
MIEKLEDFRKQLEELDQKLSDPDVMKDMGKYKSLMLERSHLVPIVDELSNLKTLLANLSDNENLAREDDEDIAAMAREEIPILKEQIEQSEKKCKMLLIPPDPLEGKNIIMEIRAGTGGEEAALFASDLYRMYSYYAESMHWKIEEIDS